MSPLYFAYGSNLNTAQMRQRCPRARAEASATLPGYRIAFGGYSTRWRGAVATLEPARGGAVDGLLYRLPASELAVLDQHEGVPFLYERCETTLRDVTGHKRRVQLYLLRHAPPGTASIDYLLTILRAYQKLGFNRRAVLDAAYRCSPCASSCTAP